MTKYLVFGHKNPDTDTIASAIAMAYLLKELGSEAEPVALGTPNEETSYALNYFQVDAPRVITSASQEVSHVALVDHNEAAQSVDDLKEVTVDYVIDHHRIQFETAQPLYYRAEPIGCTASVLYKMFQEHDVAIPKAIAGLMLSAIISDTLLFKSPTCTQQDITIAHKLAEIAQVQVETYGLDLLKAGTDLSSKSNETLLAIDAKNFEMGGKTVRIAQVNTIGFDVLQARKPDLLNLLAQEALAHQYAVNLLVVTDVLSSDSIGFVVGDDLTPVTRAFGKEVVAGEIQLPGVVSRKKQIVPPLTEAMN